MGESKIKQGYKKTPVGMIPEDWSVKIFGECFKHLRAYTFSRNQLNYVEKEDAVYNIHYGDIHSTFPKNLLDVKKDIDLIPIIISSELEAPELLKDGDLIMADASEDYKGIGQSIELINVGDRKIVSGTHTFPLRPVEKFAPKYAGYIFSNFNTHKEVKRIATGISVYGISKANLSKIKLPIPPLPEQKAIADCLSTWDKGIEKLSALITSKKEQKKGLMQQLLTGKKRLDGFTEEWNPKRLNVIGKVNYGTRIVKGNVEEGDYFVYGGGGKTFTNKEYNREDRMVIARFAMSKECARFVKGKFYLNDSGLTIDANEKTNQSFLDYLLFFNQHNIYKLRAGGAQQNLDVQAFRGISLSIPSIEEQTVIAEVLTAADKEIELLEQKLASFKMQ